MNDSLTPATLRIIRFAMLAGVLLLGMVATYVDQTSPLGVESPIDLVAMVLTLAAAATVMLVRRRIENETRFDRRWKPLLVAAAVCEGAGLLGGVALLLSGTYLPFVAAAVVFGFSLILLPIEAAR